jgi:hypothetical protein
MAAPRRVHRTLNDRGSHDKKAPLQQTKVLGGRDLAPLSIVRVALMFFKGNTSPIDAILPNRIPAMPQPVERTVHFRSHRKHDAVVPEPKGWIARIVRRVNSALLD